MMELKWWEFSILDFEIRFAIGMSSILLFDRSIFTVAFRPGEDHMKRVCCLALAALVVATIPATSQPPASQPPAGSKPAFQSLKLDEALALARREKKMVMVDFGATWCGPCKMMEATTFKNQRVEMFLADNLIAIKVDIDNEKASAQKHNVTAVPTILFLDSNGKEVERIIGFKNAEQFLEALTKVKGK
jgi:thiol:disulfide interchange protein